MALLHDTSGRLRRPSYLRRQTRATILCQPRKPGRGGSVTATAAPLPGLRPAVSDQSSSHQRCVARSRRIRVDCRVGLSVLEQLIQCEANGFGNLTQQDWRDVAPLMKRHCGAAAGSIGKLFVRAALTDFDEAESKKNGHDLVGLKGRECCPWLRRWQCFAPPQTRTPASVRRLRAAWQSPGAGCD